MTAAGKVIKKGLLRTVIPVGLLAKVSSSGESGRSVFKEKIREHYRKWLLVMLATAFFMSVLYLADRLPAPKRKTVSQAPVAEEAPKKGHKGAGQLWLGIVVALVMVAVVGAGIWWMVQRNGGKSAKESVGSEEVYSTEAESGESDAELWSFTSDAVLELPEEPTEAAPTESVTETVEEEPEEKLSSEDLVMPGRQAIAGDVIFVGDSRFVGMSTAVRFDDLYIAQVAIGYDWFRDTAVPEVDKAAVPGAKVVINMGVNDLENVNRYAELINECMERWSAAGLTVYFMSVNPVIDGKSYATNEMIEKFNARMQEILDPRVQWIDTYTPLMESGIQSPDGVHYREETSRLIYEYCKRALEESAAQTPASGQLELQMPEDMPGGEPGPEIPGAEPVLPQTEALPAEGTLEQTPEPAVP